MFVDSGGDLLNALSCWWIVRQIGGRFLSRLGRQVGYDGLIEYHTNAGLMSLKDRRSGPLKALRGISYHSPFDQGVTSTLGEKRRKNRQLHYRICGLTPNRKGCKDITKA